MCGYFGASEWRENSFLAQTWSAPLGAIPLIGSVSSLTKEEYVAKKLTLPPRGKPHTGTPRRAQRTSALSGNESSQNTRNEFNPAATQSLNAQRIYSGFAECVARPFL
jgi:hypothetical protein